MKVLLGNYHVGQTYHNLKEYPVEITKGPFKESQVFFPKISKDNLKRNEKTLPPLTHHSEMLIDFTPFVLYERVIIDEASYNTIMNRESPLLGISLPKKAKNILEDLRDEGILEVIDFFH